MMFLFCLFDLFFYFPSTIFQLNRDGSSWVEQVLSKDKCVLLKDHNAVTLVRLQPVASQSRVKHSTTEPLHSLVFLFCFVALRPKSTAMVMAGQSVHLTTLFPGQA